VVNLLGGVELLEPKDYLASALAMVQVGDLELASHIIEDYSNIEWLKPKPAEIYIHYKLYQLLEFKRPLTSVEQKNIEALKMKLVNLGYSNLDHEHILDVGSFCTPSESQTEMTNLTKRDDPGT
jgi:hypothetical protein